MEVSMNLIKALLFIWIFVASSRAIYFIKPGILDGPSYHQFDLSSSESDPDLDGGRVLPFSPPEPPEVLPWYVSVPTRPLHQSMFQEVFNLLLDKGLFFNSDLTRNASPYNFRKPEVLSAEIDFTLGQKADNESVLLKYLGQILASSPRPSHPFYLSKDGAGLDPYALAGEWLSSTMNTMPLTYYLSPVATVMELAMTRKLRSLLGYPNGDGDGIPTPGPSLANIMAVNVALQQKFPTLKEKGFVGGGIPNFAIFLSEDACPSFAKAQIMLGFTSEALVRIPTDENGRMLTSRLGEELEKAQRNGVVPVMVVAVAGTRSLGAIDPLAEISNLCVKYGIWFHVDATSSGPSIMSSKQSWRLKGIEKSDSVTWSWSGLMGSMHPSAFILTKTPGILFQTFGHGASYVFTSKSVLYNISYDRGDSTLQTSRRPEIMKSWFLWKSKGQRGLAAAVDLQYENLDFFVQELRNETRNGRFRSVLPTYDSPIVLFNYIPVDIEALEMDVQNYQRTLNKFTMELKEKLMNLGLLYVSLSECQRNMTYAFAVSLANTALTKSDIKYLLDQIAFQAELLQSNLTLSIRPAVPPLPSAHFPSFVSAPIAGLHRDFYIDLFQLFLKKALFFQNKRRDPPIRFREPERLAQLMDLTLGDEGLGQKEMLKLFENTILYTPKYGHPYFLYQLAGGMDPYTIMADYVGAAINAPMLNYESSPAMSLMETEVIEATCRLVGYLDHCDGVINDGGSFSNMLALALARFHKYPKIKKEGNKILGKELVIFISEDAHYSFIKGAFSQGHGLQGVVLVRTDEKGRMIIGELRTAIQGALDAGKIPLMVGATAGTTIFGAIDPLDEIADVCAEFGLWFHVDGVYGGLLLFSEKYRGRLKGVERSDSFAVNWHKIFAGAHTMSILISHHDKIFRKGLAIEENPNLGHLFPADNLYDRTKYDDGGDKQMQGSRKSNVMKIWFLWKAKGSAGLGSHIDYAVERANYMIAQTKVTDGYELVLPEIDVLNVCFYYIPPRLRNIPRDGNYWKELDPIASRLSVILTRNGIMNVIAQNRGRNDTSFLKIPYFSSGLTDEDSKYFLRVIDAFGQNL